MVVATQHDVNIVLTRLRQDSIVSEAHMCQCNNEFAAFSFKLFALLFCSLNEVLYHKTHLL